MKVVKLKENGLYLLFTGPAIILFVLFFIQPLFMAVYYSLRDWNGISPISRFIGLQNYRRVFEETNYLTSFFFTIKYTAFTVFLLNLTGLLLALALNMKIAARGLFRAVFFTPMIISSVTVGYIWNFLFMRFFPPLWEFLGFQSLNKNWFAYSETSFAALIIVSLWQMAGYYMIIYLTGLQAVPRDILEAAEIDGAGPLRKFFYVTFPLIRPSLTICLFLSTVNGLKAFDLNYSLTAGGPFGSTQSLAFQIYLDAFKRDALSYATAKAFIFCLLVAAVSLIQVGLTKRKEVEL
jgi:raffinose/stachyose/melibiose transport system permease protein